jgi:hypothetical protein
MLDAPESEFSFKWLVALSMGDVIPGNGPSAGPKRMGSRSGSHGQAAFFRMVIPEFWHAPVQSAEPG